jgi:hypothetical protein
MRPRTLLISAAICAAVPVQAQEQTPHSLQERERYSMTPADGGFLRLDRQTGAVSFCTVKDGLSLCRASADERAALEGEVSRLTRENAELKSRLADVPSARRNDSTLPSEEEFERALSFTERFLRRMMRVFREEAPSNKS